MLGFAVTMTTMKEVTQNLAKIAKGTGMPEVRSRRSLSHRTLTATWDVGFQQIPCGGNRLRETQSLSQGHTAAAGPGFRARAGAPAAVRKSLEGQDGHLAMVVSQCLSLTPRAATQPPWPVP